MFAPYAIDKEVLTYTLQCMNGGVSVVVLWKVKAFEERTQDLCQESWNTNPSWYSKQISTIWKFQLSILVYIGDSPNKLFSFSIIFESRVVDAIDVISGYFWNWKTNPLSLDYHSNGLCLHLAWHYSRICIETINIRFSMIQVIIYALGQTRPKISRAINYKNRLFLSIIDIFWQFIVENPDFSVVLLLLIDVCTIDCSDDSVT